MNFMAGYLLGRISAESGSYVSSRKIKTDVKYSCEWWIRQCNLSIPKAKMCTLLQSEVRKGTIQKERNFQGLTIFVPTDKATKKAFIEKWSKR